LALAALALVVFGAYESYPFSQAPILGVLAFGEGMINCVMFQEKQEYWWVYISDRKSSTLLTPAYHVTALVEKEEVQLRFTAPRWPGYYTFTVCLRSDSYLGFDQMHDIKVSFDSKSAQESANEPKT